MAGAALLLLPGLILYSFKFVSGRVAFIGTVIVLAIYWWGLSRADASPASTS